MNSKIKKALLAANIILLLVICFGVMKVVNGRAAEIAVEKLQKTCAHMVAGVTSGQMTLAQAQDYALGQSSQGTYVPEIEITQKGNALMMQTSDSSVVTALAQDKSQGILAVNCTQLIAQ
ncbi:hypothetical protein GCM10007939_19510 [Amylibacter marinus]|uniref:Uncharacterized protein n=1 Tax=Amylibacter marinus TaxID=1475483 RepID=A0ABQ5VX48_9RHOB|nr:hypothetical protein [Amylibacter marinus]GLQ35668.1 hypothetical protein GCM10007939_19510 [Amylibacter marinus]